MYETSGDIADTRLRVTAVRWRRHADGSNESDESDGTELKESGVWMRPGGAVDVRGDPHSLIYNGLSLTTNITNIAAAVPVGYRILLMTTIYKISNNNAIYKAPKASASEAGLKPYSLATHPSCTQCITPIGMQLITCYFRYLWMTPNQDFKGTPLFNTQYLRNGTRQRHSYNETLIHETLIMVNKDEYNI